MLIRRKLPLWVSASPGVLFGPNLFALNVTVEHQHLWIYQWESLKCLYIEEICLGS